MAQNANQHRIFQTILNLIALTNVSIDRVDGMNRFFILHKQQFMPDFEFVWSVDLQYYRVYIHVASSVGDKANAGYCICTIGSGLTASGFCVLYAFLHKNRPNRKN